MRKVYYFISAILIVVGVICSGVFLGVFLQKTPDVKSEYMIDPAIWGQFGDIMGGVVGTIFSLVGVILLFETLSEQRAILAEQQKEQRNLFSEEQEEQRKLFSEEQKEQRRLFQIQQIESRFFELLALHTSNVEKMSYAVDGDVIGNRSIPNQKFEGKDVFNRIKVEFDYVYEYITKHYSFEKSRKSNTEWILDCIRATYNIIFFGIEPKTQELRLHVLRAFISDNYFFENLAAHGFSQGSSPIKEQGLFMIRLQRGLYGGHQSRLGHYYRTLFQIVTYIDNQDSSLLSDTDKYRYIKVLRSQLSTQEQAIFFLNALSPLGNKWNANSNTKESLSLIAFYKLIKNIPLGYYETISPKHFYPEIIFEDILQNEVVGYRIFQITGEALAKAGFTTLDEVVHKVQVNKDVPYIDEVIVTPSLTQFLPNDVLHTVLMPFTINFTYDEMYTLVTALEDAVKSQTN
ncbi:putative phage abortive infection protein [Xanthocytophaga flava]|uniref:putative phage abortive infection protein n=1 Tax=Xanthocytophaga flava TaxID=3048013 RepID=UPI0028D0FA68|nr:putative phage abortive infection protein [Xanthocytophaga flavus]MDJ1468148.1 putative phage abortive infection protein [Xanthocytophaga flavus]